jgi:hypothetical protein
MHGCACGEGNGWFEGGADSYTCKHCFQESGKSFTPIAAYYEKGISPREETLRQDLILHHTKLTTAKRHKNNEGTATADADDTEFVGFYVKYKQYLEEAIISEGVAAAATTTKGRPISASNNKIIKTQNQLQNKLLKQMKRTTKVAAAMLEFSKDAAQQRAKKNSRDDEHRARSNIRDDESNRRSDFDFYIQLCAKKEAFLKNEYSNDNNKILRNLSTEIAELEDTLGLEESS